MKSRNRSILLNDANPEQYIYRIEDIDRLIDSISENQTSFTNPEYWRSRDDKWEKIFGDTILVGDQSCKYHIKCRVQCWSTLKESDALWRIYSKCTDPLKKDYKGVQVKVKIKNYLHAIDELDHKSNFFTQEGLNDVMLAGPVKYLGISEITDILNDPWFIAKLASRYKFSQEYEKTLFIKRDSFAHENEFRILWTKKATGSIFKDENFSYLKIDYKSLIEEIILDPRINDETERKYREKFWENGISNSIIKKSTLYDSPNITPYTTKHLKEIAALDNINLLQKSDNYLRIIMRNNHNL
jgi:hypothetical protein